MSSYTYKTGVYDECLALTEEGDMAGLMKCAIEIMELKQDRVGVKLNNHLLVLSVSLSVVRRGSGLSTVAPQWRLLLVFFDSL